MYFVDNGNRHDETYSAVHRKRKMMMMITHYIITRHTHKADRHETERKKSRESDTQYMKKNRRRRLDREIERERERAQHRGKRRERRK